MEDDLNIPKDGRRPQEKELQRKKRKNHSTYLQATVLGQRLEWTKVRRNKKV
jgi:hypothetical protein